MVGVTDTREGLVAEFVCVLLSVLRSVEVLADVLSDVIDVTSFL